MVRKIYFFEYSKKRHAIHQELLKFPPSDYEFIINNNKKISVESFNKFKSNKKILWVIRILRKFISPVQVIQKISKIEKIPKEAGFVYAANGLFTKKFPWVIDLECVGSFFGYGEQISRKEKKRIERLLSNNNCKKIMPFTEYGKKTILESLDIEKFKEKIEVVHFAKDIPYTKKKRQSKIKFLFVGSALHQSPIALYSKGIKEVIKSFKILNKKYNNLELIMLTKLPQDLEEEVQKIGNIKVLFLPAEEVMRIYADADIFIFPTFIFPGLSFVEAIGNNMPVITTNIFGNPELVEHGKNGFLIDIPKKQEYKYGSVPIKNLPEYVEFMSEENGKYVVKKIVEYASRLIENPELIEKMGKNSRRKYEKEFSIEVRNRKLKKIFDSI